MNVIDRWSLSAAKLIRANHKDAASEEVLFYSISLTINTLLAICISLTLCSITGHFVEAVLVVASYSVLRFFSGGVHMPSSVSCCIMSILLFTLTAHVQFDFYQFNLGYIFTAVSIVILFIYAPQGIRNMSRIDEKYYPVLKLVSVSIVFSNFILHSSLLAVVFLIQSLLTTKTAYILIKLLERRYIHED